MELFKQKKKCKMHIGTCCFNQKITLIMYIGRHYPLPVLVRFEITITQNLTMNIDIN